MDIEKLIKRLRTESLYADKASLEIMDLCMDAATALSTLQAENEKLRVEAEGMRSNWYKSVEEIKKLRAELEQVKAERGALIEDFVDYVTGGVPNPAIFCKNRCNKCVDMRGWCTGKDCKGFYPSGASGQKED